MICMLNVSAPRSLCLIEVRFAFCLRQFRQRIIKNSPGAKLGVLYHDFGDISCRSKN